MFSAGSVALAGGVGFGSEEGDGALVEGAGDLDGVAGVGAESAGEREHFEEALAAGHRLDAGAVDGADDGDILAVVFGYGDDDLGIFDVALEVVFDLAFKFGNGQPGGVDAAGEGNVDVAARVDAEGLVGIVVGKIFDGEGYLVAGAQDIPRHRGGSGGGGGRLGDGRCGEKTEAD